MERIEVTRELKKEINQEITIAEKGNGYGDGFEYVPLNYYTLDLEIY